MSTPKVIIAPDTYVTAANWPNLQAAGVRHVSNLIDPDTGTPSYGDRRCSLIYQWEFPNAVLKGDPLVDKHIVPRGSTAAGGMVALYMTPAAEGWSDYYGRRLEPDDPRIASAGIARFFDHNLNHWPRWEFWSVHDAPDTYRCWGPADDTKFEGTLKEAIGHIQNWEAKHGSAYPPS